MRLLNRKNCNPSSLFYLNLERINSNEYSKQLVFEAYRSGFVSRQKDIKEIDQWRSRERFYDFGAIFEELFLDTSFSSSMCDFRDMFAYFYANYKKPIDSAIAESKTVESVLISQSITFLNSTIYITLNGYSYTHTSKMCGGLHFLNLNEIEEMSEKLFRKIINDL